MADPTLLQVGVLFTVPTRAWYARHLPNSAGTDTPVPTGVVEVCVQELGRDWQNRLAGNYPDRRVRLEEALSQPLGARRSA